MNNELKFYINGSWIEPNSIEQIEVLNPATEEVLGNITPAQKKMLILQLRLHLRLFKRIQIFLRIKK